MDKSFEIAKRLDQAMRDPKWDKPWSQYRLWKKSGVPQATISRILKGDQPQGPEVGTLRALAKTLGVSFNWLSEGTSSEQGQSDIVTVAGAKVLHIKGGSVTEIEDMPQATPMMMTGPHFLTPQEWLLVSLHRRMDTREQGDLLGLAERLPKLINPPIANDKPK